MLCFLRLQISPARKKETVRLRRCHPAIRELELTLKSPSSQIPSKKKKNLASIYKSLPKVGMKCILCTGALEQGLGNGTSSGRCFLSWKLEASRQTSKGLEWDLELQVTRLRC